MLDSWPVSLFGAPVLGDAGFGEFMKTPVGFTDYKGAGLSHHFTCSYYCFTKYTLPKWSMSLGQIIPRMLRNRGNV
jgi:hypothetical protein